MTVCDVISTADNILNLGIVSQLDLSSQTLAQAMSQNADCNVILHCCNGVLEELFSEHAVDCRSTVVEAVNGVIDTSALKLCRALFLVDSSGVKSPFTYCSTGLNVSRDGRYNLTYARLPDKLDFETEIPLPNCKITDRIFIYGVIAEYLRVLGDVTLSDSWAEKYKQAVSCAAASKTDLRMPSRRWLS